MCGRIPNSSCRDPALGEVAPHPLAPCWDAQVASFQREQMDGGAGGGVMVKSNFTRETPAICLSQVVKVNINSDKSCL